MKYILSNLAKTVETPKKRLGRGLGSGKGSKSGRGTTRHQRARQDIPLHFEGGQGRLVKRFPLLRGKGKNTSKRRDPVVLSLKQLNVFSDNDIVNEESLTKKGLIGKLIDKQGIKIINNGKLEKKLTIQVSVTESVKKAVEKIGGIVEVAS